ncbi:hypothetical protein ABFS82_06G104900 [Erythranthe guttata]|uniref:Glycosyltransferase n=1 Tax=Erythranthe guttata TaxID=4155 RepID=A0A022PTB4_ERYGU|nr:PREDICTED: chalcone 4'-O-glucosyltransferase-like [Erythranthe guttata]EYU19602.1 hypothetical protein MIMGU_mgv1a024078mg [Erythranthe guttata]|eukprot:XP_012858167.1 PREDICTED: chalcone 4'-O-glucosyltransferase-like [Erythranthe guttata]
MAETILVYASSEHLNSMLPLAVSITKHHPSISVVVLSTTAAAAAASSSVTYRRLPTPALPPNSDPVEQFFEIPRLNNPKLREAIEEISKESNIKAIIIDVFCYSAFEVSAAVGIPTYFCNTTGAFGLCLLLHWPFVHEITSGADGNIEIPGCPLLHSLDLPKVLLFPRSNSYKHFVDASINMRKSAGIIVNTYHALEFRAMEALANGLCVPGAATPPVYSLGPFINTEKDSSSGGGGAEAECFRWLDLQPMKSVVFLCFGRRGVLSAQQLKETAVGLENSGCRFLWAVRSPPGNPDVEALLPEGFLERTKDKGILWKGYAPQMEVLSHESVGGFVTHCGQGSLLEAVWFGVPMIGWPLYAEQRVNRVFMVEEMKVALPLEEAEDGFVTAAELEKRVRELMDSKTGTEVRRRVTEMKHSAAAAVAKGGSTVVAMEKFIEAVIGS